MAVDFSAGSAGGISSKARMTHFQERMWTVFLDRIPPDRIPRILRRNCIADCHNTPRCGERFVHRPAQKFYAGVWVQSAEGIEGASWPSKLRSTGRGRV